MRGHTNNPSHFVKTHAFLVLMLTVLLLSACGSPAPDAAPLTTAQDASDTQEQAPAHTDGVSDGSADDTEAVISGDAPRTDTPLYPGAAFVLEKTYKIAVEELYATDASVEDVIAFYADFPQFEKLSDTMGKMHGGAYLETEVMNLIMKGEAVGDEILASGPLMYLMVVPSDSESLAGIIGKNDVQKLPQGKTIISLRILTDY